MHNFIHCGLLGWFLEITFTAFHAFRRRDLKLPGATSIWMFPIYGMGALLAPIGQMVDKWLSVGPAKALAVQDKIMRHGTLYMVLIFVAEYLSGLWLRARGICPWDYTGRHSNIDGLIRLDFAPLWFMTGLLLEQITKKKGA